MLYSIVGMAGLIICSIINFEIIFLNKRDKERKVAKIYRYFIYSIMLFFTADAFWGILYDAKLITLVFLDTDLYFIAMALSVFLWTRFVSVYLEEKAALKNLFVISGLVFLVFALFTIIINFFIPMLFMFDEDGVYHAKELRYLLLVVQVFMFVVTSVHTFVMAHKTKGTTKNRYAAIGVFGIIMGFAIIAQTFLPLLPLYAIGCIIGNAAIHTFVVGSEKKEYRVSLEESLKKLEESLETIKLQEIDLKDAKLLAYTDSLTGAKSRHAYVELEMKMDESISYKKLTKFAVVVFDINGLKKINDTLGHEYGDEYIKACYKEIKDVYEGVNVYRFGGDEFVAIIIDENYSQRYELLETFEKNIDKNVPDHKAIVSSGMADFDPSTDNTLRAVFMKADEMMYKRKALLKKQTE